MDVHSIPTIPCIHIVMLQLCCILAFLGPSPPSNLNVFNKILVQELKVLQKGKEWVWNGNTKATDRLFGTVCMMVLDEPAAAKNGGWSSHGALSACPECKLRGELQHLNKCM